MKRVLREAGLTVVSTGVAGTILLVFGADNDRGAGKEHLVTGDAAGGLTFLAVMAGGIRVGLSATDWVASSYYGRRFRRAARG